MIENFPCFKGASFLGIVCGSVNSAGLLDTAARVAGGHTQEGRNNNSLSEAVLLSRVIQEFDPAS